MPVEGFLPFSKPLIARQEIAPLVEVIESGWLTTGPITLELGDRHGSEGNRRLTCRHP